MLQHGQTRGNQEANKARKRAIIPFTELNVAHSTTSWSDAI